MSGELGGQIALILLVSAPGNDCISQLSCILYFIYTTQPGSEKWVWVGGWGGGGGSNAMYARPHFRK